MVRAKKALVDLLSVLMIVAPALISVLALYFAYENLARVAAEIGRLSAERVILVSGSCKVSVIRQH